MARESRPTGGLDGHRRGEGDGGGPPYGVAAAAGALVFVLYAVTLAPTTAWWDASEYIATAYTLGIPHPPGNPFFVVVARVWAILLAPFGLTPAVRINLFAAATSAASFSFYFLIVHRTLRQRFGAGRDALIGAGASVLVGATAYTVWSQSNANEKVYTLSVLIIAVVSWLLIRWRDRAGEPGSERLVLWAVYLMVLGSTSHLMSILPAGAALVLVGTTRWRLFLDPAFLSRCALAALVGLSFNFFLPIRAAQRPVINEGDSRCSGMAEAAVAIYSNGARGCPALAASLRREQYMKPPVTLRMAPFVDQLQNYAQYFDWQWARGLDADEPVSTRRMPVTLLFLALGALGLVFMWRADRPTGIYLLVLTGTLSVALVYYLNFKYGYSLAPEIADPRAHEVRERDYFFLASFSVWGVMAGLGLAGAWKWVGDRLNDRRFASPILLVAALPLMLNWGWANRAGDYAARDWAYDLLNSVEPYGLLFTNGDNDTFPLWYLQEVEGIRRDVTVIVVQYLFTDWYPKQLRELTSPDRQRPYVPVVDGLFSEGVPPTRPAMELTDDELALVGEGPVPASFSVRFGNVRVEYPEGMYLGRGHRIALSMISTAVGERPVYFAGTGGEMATLGLNPWGVFEGLVAKLVMRDLGADPPPSLGRAPQGLGGDWFDFQRSTRLVDEVYLDRGIRAPAIWRDGATLNIPVQYYALTAVLASLSEALGDRARAQRYDAMSRDYLVTAQGGSRGRRSS